MTRLVPAHQCGLELILEAISWFILFHEIAHHRQDEGPILALWGFPVSCTNCRRSTSNLERALPPLHTTLFVDVLSLCDDGADVFQQASDWVWGMCLTA